MLFIDALGGKWPVFFWFHYLIPSSLRVVFDGIEIWWLGYWAQQYTLHHQSEVSVALWVFHIQ